MEPRVPYQRKSQPQFDPTGELWSVRYTSDSVGIPVKARELGYTPLVISH